MKKTFITLCLGLILIPCILQGITSSSLSTLKKEKPRKTDPIELEGYLRTSGTRSGGDPLTVWLDEEVIDIMFHQVLNTVDVTIINTIGIEVYATSVNTTVQYSLFIPLQQLPTGSYTILFSNDTGMMWGSFEL